MKRIKNMKRYSIVFLLMIGVCCHAWAQNVSFEAIPSASRIGVKDQLQVVFKISNIDIRDFKEPTFPDFNIVQRPYRYEEFTSVNGVQSRMHVLIVVLQPKHVGNLVINPAIAADGTGHIYKSNSLTIQVVSGTLAPPDPFAVVRAEEERANAQINKIVQQHMQQMMQPQQPLNITNDQIKKVLFIRTSTDKSKVHLGEEVVVTYKVYTQVQANIRTLTPPTSAGFWMQDFEAPKQKPEPTIETVNGKRYTVHVIKKFALFPQQTGTLTIDPAEADVLAELYVNGESAEVEASVKSDPVKVTVTPLPEKNKPADFGGAVGNYSITDKLDKQVMTTDDVATLTVNISGSGNVKLIEAPKLNLPDGLGTYEAQITDTVTSRTNSISGSKILTYAITPRAAGDYEIPAIDFPYFNPETGKYETAHTAPLKLHVKTGKNFTAAANAAKPTNEIHGIVKTPLNNISFEDKPLPLSPAYWSLYGISLLAFAGITIWKKKEGVLPGDNALQNSKQADKIALQRLSTAKELLQEGNGKPFYEEVSKAIWLYLSYKMEIPLSVLSRDAATAGMNEWQIPTHIQTEVTDIIRECETALYGSGGTKEMAHTYHGAVKVISELEGAFKA